MVDQVTCSCGNVLPVSEGMAGSCIPCRCGRTVPVPAPIDLPAQAITSTLPTVVPDLGPIDVIPPRPNPLTEIIPPMQVFIRTEPGDRANQRTQVLASLTPETIWIQDTYKLRSIPLQGLVVEKGQHGTRLVLSRGAESTAQRLILEFSSAAECDRWYREILMLLPQLDSDAPPDRRRQPEGVALVQQAPGVEHEVLARVEFTGQTQWAADRGLQLRAGIRGADAVVLLHRAKCPELGYSGRRVTGLAVRVDDADSRNRLRLTWYAEELRALLGRMLLLLLIQAALLFVLAVFCAGVSSLDAPTGETPAQALRSVGVGMGMLFAWPLVMLALVWVLRWPQLLRAAGLATMAVTTGRGLTVYIAHFLALEETGASLSQGKIWMMIDPVALAFIIIGVVLCKRAWRLADQARQILPQELQAVPVVRKAWASGLLVVTSVYAVAILGWIGTARFQASAHMLQAGVDPKREQEALLAMNEGATQANRGDLASAERSLQRALKLWEDLTKGRSAPVVYRTNLAMTLYNLGWLREQQGRLEDVEPFFARAVAIVDELGGDAKLDDDFRQNIGYARQFLNNQGERKSSRVLEDREKEGVRKYEEAELKAGQGDAAAETCYREAIAVWEEILPKAINESYRKHGTARLATAYYQLGEFQQQIGKHSAAETSLKKAVEYSEKAVTQDPDRPLLKHNLEAARQRLERLREHALEEEVSKLCAAGRYADAIDLRERSIAEQEERVRSGKDRDAAVRGLASRLSGFAWFLAHLPNGRLRDTKQAVKYARRATELQPDVGDYWYTLAMVQYRNGDWRESLASLEKVKARDGAPDASGWFLTAMVLHQLKQKKEARAALQKGNEWIDERKRQAEDNVNLRFQFELMRPAIEALQREAEKLLEGKDPSDQGVG